MLATQDGGPTALPAVKVLVWHLTRSGVEVASILHSLSPLGIFFQYGALDTSEMRIPVMEVLGKNLTIHGYRLFEVTQDAERLSRAKPSSSKGLRAVGCIH